MELTEKTRTDETVVWSRRSDSLTVTLDRPKEGNALCSRTVGRLHEMCDHVERDADIRLVKLEAVPPVFCTGMDFGIAEELNEPDPADGDLRGFASLLDRLSRLPVTLVAHVEGDAIAGGVGLAAVCDVVIAHPSVKFRLTEVIWGLQPANIAPYLIRRIGFQRAYRMALTSVQIDAAQAESYGLADFVAADATPLMRDLRTNARRMTRDTVRCTKAMFADFWLLDDAMRTRADVLMHQTLADPSVQASLRRFRESGRFPWEAE